MNLQDKVIVITGASRGLGKALAQILARRKAKLLLGARSAEELEQVAREANASFVIADVSKEMDVGQLAARAIEKFGRIDVWINNAGVRIKRTPIEEVDTEKFHAMVEVNLFGTFYGSREALKQMRKQKSGVIVNILSTSASEGKPGASAYGASKMAAIGFTRFLRNEARDTGIKVIGVFPGGMRTSFHGGQVPKDYDTFLSPEGVAEKIVANLESDDPQEELTVLKI